MKPVRNQIRSKSQTGVHYVIFEQNISGKVWYGYGVQLKVQGQVQDLILFQVRDQVWNKMR